MCVCVCEYVKEGDLVLDTVLLLRQLAGLSIKVSILLQRSNDFHYHCLVSLYLYGFILVVVENVDIFVCCCYCLIIIISCSLHSGYVRGS